MAVGVATFVLLGPAREVWPEPLEQLVRSGRACITQVSSVYEAAALVAADAEVRGLLLDSVVLTKRDIEALALVTRRLPLTMLLLPHSDLLTMRAGEAMRYGALPWKDAAVALGGLVLGNGSAVAEAAMADNSSMFEVAESLEKTMTLGPAIRYDEMSATPIVTEEEMQALLGT